MAGLGLMGTRAWTDSSAREMPKRPLGRTGFEVSLFSLGAQGVIEQAGSEEESQAIIHRALDLGVNYIDTAPSYGNGVSERNLGEVMKHRRDEVFLASKTHDRSYDGTLRLIESSLERLQTDHLDLYQLHNIRTQSDLDRAFARNGAVRAMERLRDDKVIRFLGITGHRDPAILRKGIERYDFDCILLALNAADKHHLPFQDDVLPQAVERGLGVIAMKVPAHGRILRPDGVPTMEKALRYVWTFPVSTAIVGISRMAQLEENISIARAFEPYSVPMMEQVASRTAHYHEEASWFKYYW